VTEAFRGFSQPLQVKYLQFAASPFPALKMETLCFSETLATDDEPARQKKNIPPSMLKLFHHNGPVVKKGLKVSLD
jgi:hypothetical protein